MLQKPDILVRLAKHRFGRGTCKKSYLCCWSEFNFATKAERLEEAPRVNMKVRCAKHEASYQIIRHQVKLIGLIVHCRPSNTCSIALIVPQWTFTYSNSHSTRNLVLKARVAKKAGKSNWQGTHWFCGHFALLCPILHLVSDFKESWIVMDSPTKFGLPRSRSLWLAPCLVDKHSVHWLSFGAPAKTFANAGCSCESVVHSYGQPQSRAWLWIWTNHAWRVLYINLSQVSAAKTISWSLAPYSILKKTFASASLQAAAAGPSAGYLAIQLL